MLWRRFLKAHTWIFALVRGCATVALAIATAAFCGHLTNRVQWYQWGRDMGMPFNTSIALEALSIAVFVMSLFIDSIIEDRDNAA